MTAPVPCPACQHPSVSNRCEECGAALNPGGFRVERLIHQSARGRLYLARAEDGAQFAVKELVFASVPSVEELEAFEREARTLQQLAHPRIPRLVRFFEEGRGAHLRFYLVQTFIAGPSLLDRLSSQRYSEADALEVAREVLEILRYLHGLSPRVLHRDIKPANLIQREDGLFLVDFDCARELRKGVTHQSTLVGTFGYSPPEQLGGTVDASSDLYALGATLVHLLSRKLPSELLGPGMRLHFEGAVNVSPRTQALLARLLDVDPSKRFRSAEEALVALQAPAPPKARGVSGRHPARRTFPWRVALGVAVACLALAVVSHNASRDSASAPTAASRAASPPASSAQVTFDHPFVVNGLEITPLFIEQREKRGPEPSDPTTHVQLRFEVRANSPHTARVAWWGLGTRWLQYATLLSSSQECIRCETVKPAQAFFTFPDGRQEEAHRLNEEVASYFMVDEDEMTPGLMMTVDVGFDAEPGRLPLAVRFFDGHVVVLPWGT
ncbi:serine/threonine protein kinase [Pyxidicoccus trucidator]|uniref:serine/threonine protein kinase n=1 Tax=Pyxidicoccus trucidator TaxID=2709662 RepID=UPI0013DAED64|nr:serine/threonine-protein kinase [Pyxidicoccus trucidator]